MYCANNIQSANLISNFIEVIEKEKGFKIEISVHQEADFQMDPERKLFYKNYNRSDEEEHISLNHRKVPTIYCASKYRNTLAVHLLSSLSSDTDSKYPTSGCQ